MNADGFMLTGERHPETIVLSISGGRTTQTRDGDVDTYEVTGQFISRSAGVMIYDKLKIFMRSPTKQITGCPFLAAERLKDTVTPICIGAPCSINRESLNLYKN